MMKKDSISALTLMELLIAVVLLGVVVVGGTAVTRSAFNAQKQVEDSAIFSLAEAAQGVESIFQRAVTSQEFTLPNSSEVRFTRQGVAGRVYKDGNKLLYQSKIGDASTAVVILDNVKGVNLSLDALNRLAIEIEMNDAAQTKIRSAVRTRNPYEPQTTSRMIIN